MQHPGHEVLSPRLQCTGDDEIAVDVQGVLSVFEAESNIVNIAGVDHIMPAQREEVGWNMDLVCRAATYIILNMISGSCQPGLGYHQPFRKMQSTGCTPLHPWSAQPGDSSALQPLQKFN